MAKLDPIWHIHSAQVNWDQDTPIAMGFDDVYFSKHSGLAETEHVFLRHNDLPRRFGENGEKGSETFSPSPFTIIETGFGTGLNFLACCRLWHHQAATHERWLHFVSLEKFPLKPEDLAQALAHWPELSDLAEALMAQYPPLIPGFHRLHFPQWRITLTLCFGDVNGLLPLVNAQADAWFLDGFAPAKNPEMWQPELFAQMRRLSHPSATVATFTAAGFVRRGLQQAGFTIEKVPGYGSKREMLRGVFEHEPTKPVKWPVAQAPWFANPRLPQWPTQQRHCLVVGGGLAGTAQAWSLAQRGFEVTLLERHGELAQEASGNHSGVLFTKLSPHFTPQNRWYQLSFLHALNHTWQLLGDPGINNGDWSPCGVLQIETSEADRERYLELEQGGLWPRQVARRIETTESEALTGVQGLSGLWFPQAGWLHPPALCRARVDHPNIELALYSDIESLRYEEDGETGQWRLQDSNQQTWQAPLVVLANAADARRFAATAHLPLRSIRGQVSHVPSSAQSERLKSVLCYSGYASPARDGMHSVGATFAPRDRDTDLRPQDHDHNLEQLAEASPALADWLAQQNSSQLPGRASLRCQTPDYLPVVGPAPNLDHFASDYIGLAHGQIKRHYPLGRCWPGLYLNLAHGSRGLTTTALAAEMVSAYIAGEPQPVDEAVRHATHPGRFIIRDLKRNKLAPEKQ